MKGGSYKLRKAPKRELYWVVNKITGEKYSKDPIPKERAKAQMRALYRSERLEGNGWVGDAFGYLKKAASTVTSKASSVVQRVRDVAKGKRQDYSPKVRAFLAEHGHKTIEGMLIRRDPIRGVLHTVINALTLGRWEQVRKKYAYDKVFHLGLEVKLANGPTTIIEKNEVIFVGPSKPHNEDTEVFQMSDPGALTLQTLLDNTQKLMGGNYFNYSAFENNCQDFILAILKANNLWTVPREQFIKQPMTEVIKELPSYTGSVANVATDLAAVADVALQGQGTGEAAAFMKALRGGGFESSQFFGALSKGATPRQAMTEVRKAVSPIAERQQQLGEESRERVRKATETPEALKHFLTATDIAADIMENLPVVGNVIKGIKAVRDVVVPALSGGAMMTKVQYDAYLARLPADAPRQSYDKYVADYEAIHAARKIDVKPATKQRCVASQKYDPEKEYRYGDSVCVEKPDGTVTNILIEDPDDPIEPCMVGHPMGPKKNFGMAKRSECARINEEGLKNWESNRSGSDKFFSGLLKGLVSVGDFAADTAGEILPGVGKAMAAAYKQFAPPGSSYYQPDKSTADKIIDSARSMIGLGKGQKVTMSLSAFKKEHKHLINLLRKYKKPDLLAEAADQEAEMKQYTGKGHVSDKFLTEARNIAKSKGLNWKTLQFSTKPDKKLMITTPEGKQVHFGSSSNMDYIQYKLNNDPEAESHRKSYLARATKIRGKWKDNKYSPNSLAISILW